MADTTTLELSVIVGLRQLATGLSAAERNIQSSADKIGSITQTSFGQKLRTAALWGAAGITALWGGFKALQWQVARTGREFDDVSHIMQLSTEAVGILSYFADITNTSLYSLTYGARSLSSAMVYASKGSKDYADAFRLIGVNVKDARGNLRDLSGIFFEVLYKLVGIPNMAVRIDAANKLLGRGAIALLPLLSRTQKDIVQMARDAVRLGKPWSAADAKAATDFTWALTGLRTAVASVGEAFAIPTLHSATRTMRTFTDLLVGVIPKSRRAGQALADGMDWLDAWVRKKWNTFSPWLTRASTLLKNSLSWLWDKAPTFLADQWDTLKVKIGEAWDYAKTKTTEAINAAIAEFDRLKLVAAWLKERLLQVVSEITAAVILAFPDVETAKTYVLLWLDPILLAVGERVNQWLGELINNIWAWVPGKIAERLLGPEFARMMRSYNNEMLQFRPGIGAYGASYTAAGPSQVPAAIERFNTWVDELAKRPAVQATSAEATRHGEAARAAWDALMAGPKPQEGPLDKRTIDEAIGRSVTSVLKLFGDGIAAWEKAVAPAAEGRRIIRMGGAGPTPGGGPLLPYRERAGDYGYREPQKQFPYKEPVVNVNIKGGLIDQATVDKLAPMIMNALKRLEGLTSASGAAPGAWGLAR